MSYGGQYGPGGSGPGAPGPGGPGGRPPRGAGRPVIPLRPLGLGDVLGGAFTVFRRNARVLVLWGLVLSGVLGAAAQIIQSLAQSGFQSRVVNAAEAGSDADAVFAGSFTGMLVLAAVIFLLTALGKAFLQAPVAVDTGQRVLGRRGTFAGLWGLLAGRRLAVVWWVLLEGAGGIVLLGVVATVVVTVAAGVGIGAAVGVGLPLAIGFYVVVAWLGVKFSMTIPTIAMEGLGPVAAAAQSWRLTRGAWWRTFGILLLVGAMFGIAANIAATPLTIATVFASGVFDPLSGSTGAPGLSTGGVVAVVLGGVLVAAVTTVTDVLTASVLTLLTIDRRIRTEGLDQRIASHLETGSPTDPYAPAPAGAAPTRAAPWSGFPGGGPGGPGQWPAQQQWPAQPQQWPGQQQWTPPPAQRPSDDGR